MAADRPHEIRAPARHGGEPEDRGRPAGREGTLEFARRAGDRAAGLTLPGRFHEPFNDVDAEEVSSGLRAWLG